MEQQRKTTGENQEWDCRTKYDDKYLKQIRWEAGYTIILFSISVILIFLNYMETFEVILKFSGDKKIIFHKVAYCVLAGFMGGTTFSLKYFYRVVARGLWDEDRKYWRYFAPFISIPLSIVMAAIMVRDVTASSTAAVSVGFLTGYFSDEAVSKLYDIACALFLKADVHYVYNQEKEEIEMRKQKEEKENDLDSGKR